MTDTQRINKMQELTAGKKWILRRSTTGRGLRLHVTSSDFIGHDTIREAIDSYFKKESKDGN